MSIRRIAIDLSTAGVRRYPINARYATFLSVPGPFSVAFQATTTVENTLPIDRPGQLTACDPTGFRDLFIIVAPDEVIAGGAAVIAVSNDVQIEFPGKGDAPQGRQLLAAYGVAPGNGTVLENFFAFGMSQAGAAGTGAACQAGRLAALRGAGARVNAPAGDAMRATGSYGPLVVNRDNLFMADRPLTLPGMPDCVYWIRTVVQVAQSMEAAAGHAVDGRQARCGFGIGSDVWPAGGNTYPLGGVCIEARPGRNWGVAWYHPSSAAALAAFHESAIPWVVGRRYALTLGIGVRGERPYCVATVDGRVLREYTAPIPELTSYFWDGNAPRTIVYAIGGGLTGQAHAEMFYAIDGVMTVEREG